MKKIRGVLVDVNGEIKEHTIEYNTYEDIVKALNCDYITCVRRVVGGIPVDIYCDDEALLKPYQKPAIVTYHNNTVVEVLFGNCFLCLHTKEGAIKSLTYKMFEPILDSVNHYFLDGKIHKCLSCSLY